MDSALGTAMSLMHVETSTSDTLITEKHRARRHYFDHVTGKHAGSVAQFAGKKSLCPKATELFLHIGFVPGNITLFEGIECLPGGCIISFQDNRWKIDEQFLYRNVIDAHKYEAVGGAELARIGGDLFVGIVARLFGGQMPAVVPLSGGYDSRAILAALLEVTNARNILTFTFGTPGTLDYEIGASVARKAGVTHRAFDLTQVEVTEEKLARIAALTDANADLFQPVYLLDIFDDIGTDHVVWSGYTGDGLGGSHYRKHKSEDLGSALDTFVTSESVGLLEPRSISDEAKACIATDSIYKGVLDIHEEIFFANHVERLTTSSILPNHLRYAVPFMDDEFIQFIWGVDFKYRRDKTLFNQIWRTRYPQLLALPLKSNWGFSTELPGSIKRLCAVWDGGMNAIRPSYVRRSTNYISYEKKLRYDQRFFRLVEGMIRRIAHVDLMAYGIDGDALLEEHRAGLRDNSRALTTLASLGVIAQTFG